MTDIPKRGRLRAMNPVLMVDDLQRSLDFYLGPAGFAEPAVHGEPPCFAMMSRDGCELMLSLRGPEGTGKPNGDGTWDLYLRVADLESETASLRAAGVSIVKGPTDTFYDMREIEILDPDGYRICFGQDITPEPRDRGEEWSGTLDIGSAKLRLVLRLHRSDEGALAATVDSLDQNAKGLTVDTVAIEGPSLTFEMKAIEARYAGTVAGDLMNGTWTQRGHSWPLTFRRG
jgi:catechol 2,3-dioxygenase-like lactoylglutathione lyase family enzyme